MGLLIVRPSRDLPRYHAAGNHRLDGCTAILVGVVILQPKHPAMKFPIGICWRILVQIGITHNATGDTALLVGAEPCAPG